MSEPIELRTRNAVIHAVPARAAGGEGKPLVVALHGGGFSSAYFRAPGYSLVDALAARGLDAVLLDRPGHGGSRFIEPVPQTLLANAEALSEAIGALWQADGGRHSGVVLIGHSIGGAIALLIAAAAPAWPLLGLSVSGIGDRPPQGLTLPPPVPGQPFILPREAVQMLFFAPGAATDAALDALMAAGLPIDSGEAMEIYGHWPSIAASTAAAITVPVQWVLAEHETLWDAGDEALARLRAALSASSRADVGRFAGVGHCIEFHPASADYYSRVLGFCEGC